MKNKILIIDFYSILKYLIFSLIFIDFALFFALDALSIVLLNIIYFIGTPLFLMDVRESVYKGGTLYYLSFFPLCVFYFLIYIFYKPRLF